MRHLQTCFRGDRLTEGMDYDQALVRCLPIQDLKKLLLH